MAHAAASAAEYPNSRLALVMDFEQYRAMKSCNASI